ncbi:hypothetical protein [Amycolatopsis mediterranei]|uniref:hypothetical protein n=1 Tax=Amycolatopsis mediterranei TaxID=33910 RepID=UPI001F3D9BCB|nr:hypothetical protein [Amycolatopsis mediterranei]
MAAQQSRCADRADDLAAARLLLERLGVDPADLVADQSECPTSVPTFSEYIPVVAAAVSLGTRSTYASYWKHLETSWGSRRIDEPTPSEVKQLAEEVKANAVSRNNFRGGTGAAESFIAAARCLYHHAEDDRLITRVANPAARVSKPRRLPSPRLRFTPNGGQGLTQFKQPLAATSRSRWG